jgi:hypothetical protein
MVFQSMENSLIYTCQKSAFFVNFGFERRMSGFTYKYSFKIIDIKPWVLLYL